MITKYPSLNRIKGQELPIIFFKNHRRYPVITIKYLWLTNIDAEDSNFNILFTTHSGALFELLQKRCKDKPYNLLQISSE